VGFVATRRLPVLAVVLGLLGAVGCGNGDDASSAPSPASDAGPASQPSSVCPPAPHRLAAVLRQGARRGDRLRRLFAVRSKASFAGKAPELREGVYFVSGNDGAAVFTWAVNAQAWRTGAGLIVAADRQTRAVSPRRWIVSPELLEKRYGISEQTDGYGQARACANPTRA
jgi:hypothetical protein